MNAAVTEESASGPVLVGPGARLKEVREAQGLDLSRAASLLHLSEDKLEALEADDYSGMPGSVFVQGYLRNYARLLGVPVEPLVSAYREFSGGEERQPNLRISRVRHEVGSGHGLVRLMTWGIVLGLIVLVAIWWQGYLQWPLQPGVVTTTESPAEVLSSPEDGSMSLPSLTDMPTEFPSQIDDQGEASLALPEPEIPSSVEDQAALEMSGEAAMTPPASATSVPAPEETAAAELALPGVSTEGTAPVPAGGSGGRQILVEFIGDSWTEILDSSGDFKILGSMTAGSRRVLGGTPPYKVVLGNASVVRILVDGEPFDVTPYIRGKVARFTLSPE
jgi:cytoskeleton protein RodZ